jgi:Fe-S cluster assembly scaffold protein SufB
MSLPGVEERARQARGKKALYGVDLDLESYESEARPPEAVEKAEDLPEAVKKAALDVGVKLDRETSGAYVQIDQTPVHTKSLFEGVEILDTASALKKYDYLQDYWWKLVAPDADKYVADLAEHPPAGYFIRAKKGTRTVFPVKSCLYLGSANLSQRVHNIIIAEEGSELHIITGCTTPAHIQRGLHIGASEFYIKKGAHVSFTMIHSWGKEVDPETSAESISRVVSVGGEVIARGKMTGMVPGARAHLECVGLLLSEKGRIDSIPELDGRSRDLDMSHEAAVGRISEEELEYLMSRGLTSEQATSVIVRGFLDVEIKGLPEELRREIRSITQREDLRAAG